MKPTRGGYQRIYAKRGEEEKPHSPRQTTATLDPAESEITTATTAIPAALLQRAQTAPKTLSSHEMLKLQSALGNQAVARMVNARPRQMSMMPAIGPHTVQRTPFLQRLPNWWPFKKKERTEGDKIRSKIKRINVYVGLITAATTILRIGHGVVMLPFTLIDLISNIATPFLKKNEGENQRSQKDKANEVEMKFHTILNGETQLVHMLAGGYHMKNADLQLSFLRYAPYNFLPWIIKLLGTLRQSLKAEKTNLQNKLKSKDEWSNTIKGNKISLE
ncbi:MAG: hypothetical protein U0670_06835 [Anaerolineae bacterium]